MKYVVKVVILFCREKPPKIKPNIEYININKHNFEVCNKLFKFLYPYTSTDVKYIQGVLVMWT
jgi:hypothetical protein